MTLPASDRLIWLDLARGACSLMVCASHLRLVTTAPYDQIASPTPLQTVLYLATGWASQAVWVFFVLSGYLVGGAVLRAGAGFDPVGYLVARVVRLWVPLIPALFITLAVDSIILRYAPGFADGEFHARWNSGPRGAAFDEWYTVSALAFLGNLAFLQTICIPWYGSNAPLWTLACEFWYYVLFPLFARAAGWVGDRRTVWVRVVAGLLAVAVFAMLKPPIRAGFVIWLMGVGAAALTRREARPHPLSVLAGLAAFAVALLYSKMDFLQYRLMVPSKYVIGLGFAALCTQLVRLPPPPWAAVRWAATTSADVSYTLYLVHFPVVVLIGTTWYADTHLNGTGADIAVFLALLAGLVLFGWACWFAFERHTGAVRAWMLTRLGRVRGGAVGPVTAAN
jgi:peptidoglycan/LPS O-acetylase OafA/YrhL